MTLKDEFVEEVKASQSTLSYVSLIKSKVQKMSLASMCNNSLILAKNYEKRFKIATTETRIESIKIIN